MWQSKKEAFAQQWATRKDNKKRTIQNTGSLLLTQKGSYGGTDPFQNKQAYASEYTELKNSITFINMVTNIDTIHAAVACSILSGNR